MADKDYASLHFEEEFAKFEKTDNKKQKELQKQREKEQKQKNKVKAKQDIAKYEKNKQEKKLHKKVMMNKFKPRNLLFKGFIFSLRAITLPFRYLFEKIKQMFSPKVYVDEKNFRDTIADEIKKQQPKMQHQPEPELSERDKEVYRSENTLYSSLPSKNLNIIELFEGQYGKEVSRTKMFEFLKEYKKENIDISLDEYCKAIGYATNSMITFNKEKNVFVCDATYEKKQQQKMISFEVDKDFNLLSNGYKNNSVAKDIISALRDNYEVVKETDRAEIVKNEVQKNIQKDIDKGKDVVSDVIELQKKPLFKNKDEKIDLSYNGETMELESEYIDDILADDLSNVFEKEAEENDRLAEFRDISDGDDGR